MSVGAVREPVPLPERMELLLAGVRASVRDGGHAAAREAAEQLWAEAGGAGLEFEAAVVEELRAIPGVRLREPLLRRGSEDEVCAVRTFWYEAFGYGRIAGLAGSSAAAARAAFAGTILGTARGTGWPPVPRAASWPGPLVQRRDLLYHLESTDYFRGMRGGAVQGYLDALLPALFPEAQQAARDSRQDELAWDYCLAGARFHLVTAGTVTAGRTTLVVDWAGPPELVLELNDLAARYQRLRSRQG